MPTMLISSCLSVRRWDRGAFGFLDFLLLAILVRYAFLARPETTGVAPMYRGVGWTFRRPGWFGSTTSETLGKRFHIVAEYLYNTEKFKRKKGMAWKL
ncbi:MAG: hypothetical protein HY673_14335 [Chloroflexi bacterium]|nr:hypothetical protein [Chloroflexota bacterium]